MNNLNLETLRPSSTKRTKRQARQLVLFTLSMPSVGSWDGKWSGEHQFYGIVRSLSIAEATTLEPSYYYGWSDGWGACVKTRLIDGQQSRYAKKHSKGFCGYEWMVDSILRFGQIYATHEEPNPKGVAKTEGAQGSEVHAQQTNPA